MYFLDQVEAVGQLTKLMLIKDTSLNTYYLELVCKSVHINAEVLHASLSDAKRVLLMKRFKNPNNSLVILVILYQVSL